MDHIQACEISWRLDSGEVFHVTRMHPEPRQVHTEDLLTPRHSHSSINAVEGQCCHILLRSVVHGDILLTGSQVLIVKTFCQKADRLAACQEQVVIVLVEPQRGRGEAQIPLVLLYAQREDLLKIAESQ